MDQVELIIQVPKSYIEEAQDFGLLEAETITQVLQDELDARIMRFVDNEVKAHRAE